MESTFNPRQDLRTATSGWWLVLLMGLISVVAGVIVLAKPGDSLETLAVISGIFLLVYGILELAAALMSGTDNRGMVALVGALTAIVGVLLIRHPISGVAAVALLIALWLIAIGVVRFVFAFATPVNRGWNIFVGLVQMAAGVVIIVDPEIGFATLALLVGLGFIFNGVATCILGWGMHRAHRDAAA
jgi:uncharacterized membrane protein HdeD (DUF308 family)